MRKIAESRILAAAAVIVSAATAVIWCPPSARAEQPPVSHPEQEGAQAVALAETPLLLEMSLSQEAFGHGEPLLLAYTLHNASDRHYEYDLGLLATEWFRLTLRDPQGNVVPLKKDFYPVVDPGQQRKRGGLGPKGKYTEERLCLNRWLTFPQPGVYELTVQARIPFLENPPRTTTAARVYVGEEAEAYDARFTKAPALTTTRVFRLRVLPTTTDALRATARDLHAAFRKTGDRVFVDALLEMPWDAASPVWREMMEQDGAGTYPLLYHNSVAAVDFVARIAWSRTTSDSVRKAMQAALAKQYGGFYGPLPERVSDRIRYLFDRHGTALPPRPKWAVLPGSRRSSP